MDWRFSGGAVSPGDSFSPKRKGSLKAFALANDTNYSLGWGVLAESVNLGSFIGWIGHNWIAYGSFNLNSDFPSMRLASHDRSLILF